MLFIKNPPEDINDVYGYRTIRSKLTQETWDFAQRYYGKIWKYIGSIMLLLTVISNMILFQMPLELTEDTAGMIILIETMIQIVVMLVCIYPVEKALKKNFDEKGKPKREEI